ncbi:MAG: amino acid racemase [Defluviitaleaceae bacterium]|nr:amino acid racemase [Defluviitaleaceae bacterium]MCL2274144.1 amino acid racemase [Defluviitaleaceae bacterium]
MTIGVIGGMGVQATALFYEKFIALQTVDVEQEYADILIYSKSSIPDRTAFIIGESENDPAPALIHAAQTLEAAGVACIAVPCITSHYFYPALSQAVFTPILHLPQETASHVASLGHEKIGLLATNGTLHGQMFHHALAEKNIETLTPDEEMQKKLMDFIYRIKKNRLSDPRLLHTTADALLAKGAQTIILGCTELSVALAKEPRVGYCDALEILAQAALTFKQNYLKEECA